MEIFILQDDLYANMRKERKKLNNPGLRLFRMRGQGTVDRMWFPWIIFLFNESCFSKNLKRMWLVLYKEECNRSVS